MILTFEVLGEPVPQGSACAFRHRSTGRVVVTHDNRRTEPWRDTVAWSAVRARNAAGVFLVPTREPVRVDITFRLPRPKSAPKRVLFPATRPDADKLVRAVLDSLSHVVFHNDAQVVDIRARKVFAGDEPVGARITVETMECAV